MRTISISSVNVLAVGASTLVAACGGSLAAVPPAVHGEAPQGFSLEQLVLRFLRVDGSVNSLLRSASEP